MLDCAGETAYDLALRMGLVKIARLFEKNAVRHAWLHALVPKYAGMSQEWRMMWCVLIVRQPLPTRALRHTELLFFDDHTSVKPRERVYTDGARIVAEADRGPREPQFSLVRLLISLVFLFPKQALVQDSVSLQGMAIYSSHAQALPFVCDLIVSLQVAADEFPAIAYQSLVKGPLTSRVTIN